MTFETIEQAREQAVSAMQSGQQQDVLAIVNQALAQYPNDGPLLFLLASELAEQQQFDAALEQFSNAVMHAPGLHIARFQLTLLASTMDRGDLVEQHLPYLMELGQSHYLGFFAHALAAIYTEELDKAAVLLSNGMAMNQDNPALNHDMQQLLDRVTAEQQAQSEQAPVAQAQTATKENDNDTEESETPASISGSVLLDIYKNTH